MAEEKKKVKRPLGKARLIVGRCIACGARCQADCRAKAIEINEDGENIADNDGKRDSTCEIESDTPQRVVMEALVDREEVVGFCT